MYWHLICSPVLRPLPLRLCYYIYSAAADDGGDGGGDVAAAGVEDVVVDDADAAADDSNLQKLDVVGNTDKNCASKMPHGNHCKSRIHFVDNTET